MTPPIEDRRQDPSPVNVERRISDLTAVLGIVTQVHTRLEQIDDKLTQHVHNETTELANEIARVLLRAFPGGDADGHRRHHELAIQKAEASTKFWQTMSTEISKWGLLGFLGWAGFALWKAFLAGPK